MPYEYTVIHRESGTPRTLPPEGVFESRDDQKRRQNKRMQNGRSELFTEGLVIRKDLCYRDDGNEYHRLDLLSPEGAGKLPVIVEIHGGGYIACEKAVNFSHAKWFAQQGFHVVNGNYTLAPEANFGDMMQELADIVLWIQNNAERFGFDTEHVYMSGDSAGGHLILLYALIQGSEKLREYFGTELPSLKIAAAAPTCPAFNLYQTGPSKIHSLLFKQVFPNGVDDEYLEKIDIAKQLPESEYPPIIITTAPGDGLLYKDDCELAQAFEKNGRDFSFRVWNNQSHELDHVFNVLFPEWEESIAANSAIVEFFRKY